MLQLRPPSFVFLALCAVGCSTSIGAGTDTNSVSDAGAPQAGTSAAPAAGSAADMAAGGAGGRAAGSGASGTTPVAGVGGMDAGPAMLPPAQPAGSGAATPMDSGMPPGMMGAAGSGTMPAAMGCDRACLIGVMQTYIDALIANDPSKLKVSSMLKYTENGELSELGETVWTTASMLMPETRLDFADPQEGQVASHFVFNEKNSMPVIYQVRLKVVASEITEIETMAVRRQGAANGFFNVANMKPEPAFTAPVPPEQKNSREELKQITELYLDYLEGSKGGRDVPFDMGCKRYENGQVTASGLSSFNSQRWSFDVTRRILVIDEEAGITWGQFPFTQAERTLVVGEAFKIVGGKIMMIQAVMANQPAKVWD